MLTHTTELDSTTYSPTLPVYRIQSSSSSHPAARVAQSYAQALQMAWQDPRIEQAVFYQQDIILPAQFTEACQRAMQKATELFGARGWGVIANTGFESPSGDLVRFCKTSQMMSVPFTNDQPLVASQFHGDVFVLNLAALRQRGWTPDSELGNDPVGLGQRLSEQCYRRGVVCLLDWELFAVSRQDVMPAESSSVELSLVEQVVLQNQRYRASLTVVVRSMLNREALLARFMEHFAIFQNQAMTQAHVVRLMIVANQHSPEQLTQLQMDLRKRGLQAQIVESPPTSVAPRVQAVLDAANHLKTDYIWFVDDDDYIQTESALHSLIWLSGSNLLIGNVQVYREIWEPDKLVEATPERAFRASDYPLSLSLADNYTPICAILYPSSLLKEALTQYQEYGDYLEDYSLFLATTRAKPNITAFHQAIAGVSLRQDGSNSVTDRRSAWDRSYATFLHETLRQKTVGRLEHTALASKTYGSSNSHRLLLRLQRLDDKLHQWPRVRQTLIRLAKLLSVLR